MLLIEFLTALNLARWRCVSINSTVFRCWFVWRQQQETEKRRRRRRTPRRKPRKTTTPISTKLEIKTSNDCTHTHIGLCACMHLAELNFCQSCLLSFSRLVPLSVPTGHLKEAGKKPPEKWLSKKLVWFYYFISCLVSIFLVFVPFEFMIS